MTRIAIVLGSTRPGRVGEQVARWVYEIAKQRTDAEYELVDLAAFHLPLLDEPVPPSAGKYSQPHTKAWSEKIAGFDGFVFVTAEYQHGVPAALKNAFDFLYKEWNHKAAAFVSYGSAGGARAVEQLRQVCAEVMLADVRAQVLFYLASEFENYRTFRPAAGKEKLVGTMLDQVVAWSNALRPLRSG
jgi:NAD(P)H-dependent FMN reductase